MSDSRRPYRVYPNGETQLFDIWTRADETPGSRNNYVICGNFQDPIEADEFCAAVNNIEEITKQRDQLLDALRECITNDGAHCLAYGADTPTLRARLAAISKVAHAAITQAERGAK